MLDKVKQYLKIDTTAEDEYLETLISATEEYITSSFDEVKTATAMQENTQLMLIGMLYNNRGLTEGKVNPTLKIIFDSMMLKLKTSNNKGDDQIGTSTAEE